MSGFLLDTNVLSKFNRLGDPNPRVREWLEAADSGSLYASVLTLAEIRFGVELLPASKRRTQLEDWLDRDLPAWFGDRVLSVDKKIADRWGILRAQAQIKGRPLSVVDGLLAATAVEYGLTIVSRNVADFTAVELSVINPWGLISEPDSAGGVR
jgi:predicted nucleic acid-binding protein